MIVDDIERRFRYAACKRVALYMEREDSAYGRVSEHGRDYHVQCLMEEGFLLCVVARCDRAAHPVRAAVRAAEHTQADPAWLPVAVDVKDGEVAYARKWLVDVPDAEGLDAFLAEALRFFRMHRKEVDGLMDA